MKLTITNVINEGSHESEKVEIKVLENANLKYYVVRDTSYTDDNNISNKWFHAYKFKDQNVQLTFHKRFLRLKCCSIRDELLPNPHIAVV